VSAPQPAKPSIAPVKTPPPAGSRLIGDSKMSVLPSTSTLNIGSILAMAACLGALLPKIITEYSTVGIVAAVALGAGLLIQSFIPPATAVAIENTVADQVIPAVEGFDPALKPALEQIAAGLHAAASNASAAAAKTA